MINFGSQTICYLHTKFEVFQGKLVCFHETCLANLSLEYLWIFSVVEISYNPQFTVIEIANSRNGYIKTLG